MVNREFRGIEGILLWLGGDSRQMLALCREDVGDRERAGSRWDSKSLDGLSGGIAVHGDEIVGMVACARGRSAEGRLVVAST